MLLFTALDCHASLLVEVGNERNRYLQLSSSSAAAAALAEDRAEQAAALTRTLRETQAQLAAGETALAELKAERAKTEGEYETHLRASIDSVNGLKASLSAGDKKCELLTDQVGGLEQQLRALTAELEAERGRCAELQSGLGQQGNE